MISWNPDPYAKEYEVEISTSDTFSSTIESRHIEQASWAPNVNLSLPANKGTLYWRVAAVDTGRQRRTVRHAAASSRPKPKAKCVVKKVKKGQEDGQGVRGAQTRQEDEEEEARLEHSRGPRSPSCTGLLADPDGRANDQMARRWRAM